VPRPVVGRQRRRSDPPRPRARSRPDHRHHPRRLRQPLPVEAVQPGVPALEGLARPRLARPADARRAGFRRGRDDV